MNLCPGKSVGAIIRNDRGDKLCLYRLKHPIGLALPAGHIDEGESPEEAVKREVYEETGLTVVKYELLFSETFPNPCGRGYDGHEWFVYHIREYTGEPKLMEPDKHKFVDFCWDSDILKYLERDDFDPAWSRYIFPALGLQYTSLAKF